MKTKYIHVISLLLCITATTYAQHTDILPNSPPDGGVLEAFARATGYEPRGHKFWMDPDDPGAFDRHAAMSPYNGSLMVTLMLGKDHGNPLSSQDGKVARILDGSHDRQLTQLATSFRRYGKPIYLDIGNEAEFFYKDAKNYVRAYQYVYSKVKTSNVVYYWHTLTDANLQSWRWYPGDDYVDGIALSLYNENQIRSAPHYIEFARKHGKKCAIFECGLSSKFTPKGYYRAIFEIVDRHNISLVGYAGFGDEVFPTGPYHHSRMDYLSKDLQRQWSTEVRKPRY